MESTGNDEGSAMSPWRIALVFAAIAAPDALLVICFSSMGYGLRVFNLVAPNRMDTLGKGMAFLLALWAALLFVLDYQRFYAANQVLFGLFALALMIGAAVLRGKNYPWACMLLTLFLALVNLGFLRIHGCRSASRSSFYGTVASCFGLCAFVVFCAWVCWMLATDNTWGSETKADLIEDSADLYKHVYSRFSLNYTRHCGSDKDLSIYSLDEEAEIKDACRKAATVWFLAWMAPFVAVLCNAIVSGFCTTVLAKSNVFTEGTAVQHLLIRFLLFITFMISVIYCSVYVSGAAVNLASALMAGAAIAIIAMLVWMYLEVDRTKVAEFANTSKLSQALVKAWRSDWVRALTIGGVNILLPIMCLLDMIRQKARRIKGTTKSAVPESIASGTAKSEEEQAEEDRRVATDCFTVEGRMWVDNMSTWNWCSILTKVNILGEIFFSLVVGMKVTYVLFSWLNELLSTVAFGTVAVLVFCTGIGMFMCPIVPGSAVYLFAGVVLGAVAQQGENPVGFWPGIFVAFIVGTVAKLLACCGQYSIGYAAGQLVKVQQLIGVDKIPTRAIEQILRRRGLDIGKVSILVAGPDWPTSVTCGILKLNIPQMILGTLPVAIVSIAPQTFVGALLTKEGGESGIWKSLSTAATGIAAIVQAGATLTFSYCIMKVIERDGEKLAEPRTEHAAVAALTKKEEAFVEKYKEVTEWCKVTDFQRFIIVLSVVLQLLGGFLVAADFVMGEQLCFRSFSMTDRIGDSYAKSGLEGNAINIIKAPFGWVAIGCFLLACSLHKAHSKAMSRLAASKLKHIHPSVPDMDGVISTEPVLDSTAKPDR